MPPSSWSPTWIRNMISNNSRPYVLVHFFKHIGGHLLDPWYRFDWMGYLALQVLALASTQRKESRVQKVPDVDRYSGTLCLGATTYKYIHACITTPIFYQKLTGYSRQPWFKIWVRSTLLILLALLVTSTSHTRISYRERVWTRCLQPEIHMTAEWHLAKSLSYFFYCSTINLRTPCFTPSSIWSADNLNSLGFQWDKHERLSIEL